MSAHRDQEVVAVRERFEFYRDGYRRLYRNQGYFLAVIAVLIVALAAVSLLSKDRILAQAPDGRLLPLHTLDQPVYTPARVVSWATQAATEVLTFGFHDRRMRFQHNRRFFTDDGWESFLVAMGPKKSRFIEIVDAKSMILSSVPTGAGVITREGKISGTYGWEVEFPMLVTLQGQGVNKPETWKIRLIVVQVPTVERIDGLAFASMVVER